MEVDNIVIDFGVEIFINTNNFLKTITRMIILMQSKSAKLSSVKMEV